MPRCNPISLLSIIAMALLYTPVVTGQLNELPDDEQQQPVTLQAEQLYIGVNRPLMIRLGDHQTIGEFSLVLLDAEHHVVSGPVTVRPGRSDLSELMPEIWQLREAVYVQLLEYDRPSGSALVLQPMLTRMVPVTQQATRPGSSATYKKIVGWRSEMEPAPVEEESAPGDQTNHEDGKQEGGADQNASPSSVSSPIPAQDSTADVFAVDDRLLSGIRAYPERDVEMITDEGRILLMMRPDEAPNTVWNFLRLCAGGFYREVPFHRVVPLDRAGRPFVIQAGDPTATGEGGPGYWLPIEPSELPHDVGVISMARADDPDSAGSQFFICLSREGTARLDGQYCAFGTALDGADTIWRIAETELADVAAGRPVDAPLILETRLIPSPARVPGEPRLPTWKQPTLPEVKLDRPKRVPR